MVTRARVILFLLICALPPMPGHSQTKSVSGSVTDEAGAPLQDVTIEFPADANTSYPKSDADGHFRFAIVANSVIFRRAGFMSQRVSLSDLTNLRIILRHAPLASVAICKQTNRAPTIPLWNLLYAFHRYLEFRSGHSSPA
jgi:hypothetical protein